MAAALIVGLLTLYSMAGVWSEVFWKQKPEQEDEPVVEPLPSGSWLLHVVSVAVLVALMALIGFWPAPFFDFAHRAAEQLVNPSDYIQAVLGKSA